MRLPLFRPNRSLFLPVESSFALLLSEFISVWMKQDRFPDILRPYCSSLLERVASEASDLDLWTAVADLLVAFNLLVAFSHPADGEVLSFMLKNPSKEIKKEINDSPKAHRISSMRNLEENRKAASNSPALEKLKSAIRNQQPEDPPAREPRPTKRARQPEQPPARKPRPTKRNQQPEEPPARKPRPTKRKRQPEEPPARKPKPTKRAWQPEEEPHSAELRSTKRNRLSVEGPSMKKSGSTERNQ